MFFFLKKKERKKEKKSDEYTKEELKRAGIRMQVLKLFFQQCARDRYSDQFQCRLALPIDQPSLVSNIRTKSEPCNLQRIKIDQGIESSDGQSWKSRIDGPTHTHTHTEASPSDEEKKASAKLFRNAPRPRFVLIFLVSSKKMDWRPPAPPSTPLPCSNTTSCQCQWLLLLLLLPLSR